MPTEIRKIGNSAGLLFSKAVLEQLRVRQGDLVDLTVENGVLTFEANTQVSARRMGSSSDGDCCCWRGRPCMA